MGPRVCVWNPLNPSVSNYYRPTWTLWALQDCWTTQAVTLSEGRSVCDAASYWRALFLSRNMFIHYAVWCRNSSDILDTATRTAQKHLNPNLHCTMYAPTLTSPFKKSIEPKEPAEARSVVPSYRSIGSQNFSTEPSILRRMKMNRCRAGV